MSPPSTDEETETAENTKKNDAEPSSRLTETAETIKEGGTEPLKWTPFPPPDMNALLSQMTPVRVPLTLEQLCAPISDDEEEDGIGETSSGISDVYMQLNSKRQSTSTNDVTILPHTAVKPQVTISCATTSSDNDNVEVSAGTCGAASSSIKTQAGRRNTTHGQPITHFKKINNSRISINEAQSSTSKQTSTTLNQRRSSQPLTRKPLHSDFIDLTDSSDKVVHVVDYQEPKKAGTSLSSFKSTAPNQASCSNESSRRSKGKKLQSHTTEPEDEFDQLCVDIDLDTIDDFSDEESEVGPSHACDSLSTTNNSSAVSYSGQNSSKIKTYDHGSWKGKSSTRDSQLSKCNPLPHESVCTFSGDTRVPSIQPPVASTISSRYTTPASSQFTYPISTACEKRGKRPNDFEVSVSAKQPRPEDTSRPTFKSAPSASISKGQNTSQEPSAHNVRKPTTVADYGVGSISQKLNTEHCPMCNTKFPAW